MEFNQYANEYHQLSALVDAWDRKVSETGKKLAWYGGFNLVTAGQEIDQARAEITGKEKQVKILDSEIWEITNKDKEREHELGSNFNPLNWFSAHQRDIKLARKVLQHAIREKQTQRSAQLSAILGIRNKIPRAARLQSAKREVNYTCSPDQTHEPRRPAQARLLLIGLGVLANRGGKETKLQGRKNHVGFDSKVW